MCSVCGCGEAQIVLDKGKPAGGHGHAARPWRMITFTTTSMATTIIMIMGLIITTRA